MLDLGYGVDRGGDGAINNFRHSKIIPQTKLGVVDTVSPLPEDTGQKNGARFGVCKYTYDESQSEGNRFIVDSHL